MLLTIPRNTEDRINGIGWGNGSGLWKDRKGGILNIRKKET